MTRWLLPLLGAGLVACIPVRPGAGSPTPVSTRDGRDVWMDSLVHAVRREVGVPALAVAAVQGDDILVATAGTRRLSAPDTVSVRDRFYVGSVAKQMTNVVLGTLVDEGRLTWTTTLAEAFPALRDSMDPSLRGVTLLQLLQHRSGLEPYTDYLERIGELTFPGDAAAQRHRFVARLLSRPPASPPGSKYLYSNAGLAVAGAMAEQVTGQPWEVLVRQRVFEPLGMTTASFGLPVDTAPDQPWGHTSDSVSVTPVPDDFPRLPPALQPAGGVSMTIADLARFARMQLQAARGRGRLLKPETFDTIGVSAETIVSGSNTAFLAEFRMLPDENLAVVSIANADGPGAARAMLRLRFAIREHYADRSPDRIAFDAAVARIRADLLGAIRAPSQQAAADFVGAHVDTAAIRARNGLSPVSFIARYQGPGRDWEVDAVEGGSAGGGEGVYQVVWLWDRQRRVRRNIALVFDDFAPPYLVGALGSVDID